MTLEELKALNLPIEANDLNALYTGAAIDWLTQNTTLEVSKEAASVAALPDGAKLFLCRYIDIMSTDGNVTSESIAGMSQSFGTASKETQLWQLASELIRPYLKSQVRSIGNVSKWK